MLSAGIAETTLTPIQKAYLYRRKKPVYSLVQNMITVYIDHFCIGTLNRGEVLYTQYFKVIKLASSPHLSLKIRLSWHFQHGDCR